MSEKTAKSLRCEDRGAVRILTICNPARRNALDFELLESLRAAFAGAADDGVRSLVLTGEGDRAFCAGMDLDVVHGETAGAATLPAIERAMSAIEDAPPVVACLNGVAYGAGCELACTCDFRIARKGLEICITPTRLGLVYSAEGIARVASVVGLAHAKRMFLTAQPVRDAQALAWGLVDEIHPGRRALAAAVSLAEQIAQNAPLALNGTKRAFAHLSRVRLDKRERAELLALQQQTFGSEDAREALAAFKARRKPAFHGR